MRETWTGTEPTKWLPTNSVQQPMATRQKQLMGVFLNIFAQKYKEK